MMGVHAFLGEPEGLCVRQMQGHRPARTRRRCEQTRDSPIHLAYKCALCDQKFWSIDARLQHIDSEHGRELNDAGESSP